MAVGDSTGGFQHTQNNTGSQIQSASTSIAGTVGEVREVPMPEAAHTASLGEGLGILYDKGTDLAGGLWDKAGDGLSWLWDHTGGAAIDYGKSKYEEWMPKVGGSDGIFVGMDTNNVDNFKSALGSYIEGAQSILDELNLDPDMEITLKGTNIESSFHEFLDAIKTLLSAYVQSMHGLEKEIDEAADNYRAADTKIGTDVSGDAGEIRSQAGSIDVA